MLRGKLRSDFEEMEFNDRTSFGDYLGYEGTELDHSVSQWPETVLLFPGNHIRVSKEKSRDWSLATASVNTVFDL